MKKLIALLLAAALCLSMAACSAKKDNEEALKLSETAFQNAHKAFTMLDKIGKDVLSVWNMVLQNESTLRRYGDGFDLFCDNVSLSRDDVLDGLAYLDFAAGEGYSTYELTRNISGNFMILHSMRRPLPADCLPDMMILSPPVCSLFWNPTGKTVCSRKSNRCWQMPVKA